jgi:5-methylcytosine-specific restriction protein B
MNSLLELCTKSYNSESWAEESESAFEEVFGSNGGRYPLSAKKDIQFRTPAATIPFSAIIHESNPTSGGYSGMSFVIFPIEGGPTMIAMVVGTQGLSPDENIIGKPGHSRKMNAIVRWLNEQYSGNEPIAWAKKDAVRTDISVPQNVVNAHSEYKSIFDRYGKEIYGFCIAKDEVAEKAVKVLLDFNIEERGYLPLSAAEAEFKEIKSNYFSYLMPTVNQQKVSRLLKQRKYVVLQGPPGTGKTRLANKLLEENYGDQGMTIQFHPNITYENFIGGLFPQSTGSDLGLNFEITRGHLLEAIEKAYNTTENVLLVIDEINRADLAKVLGEAIYGLEPYEDRTIQLPYDFGGEIGQKLTFPNNLHILGTMNTADRSIAILDVAIRRRFAFLNMWPQVNVVEEKGNEITKEAYQKLLSIFINYASEDSFDLMPGHSYFIAHQDVDAATQMQTNLIPLLKEYLAQGYVANFADAIHAYIQEIEQL